MGAHVELCTYIYMISEVFVVKDLFFVFFVSLRVVWCKAQKMMVFARPCDNVLWRMPKPWTPLQLDGTGSISSMDCLSHQDVVSMMRKPIEPMLLLHGLLQVLLSEFGKIVIQSWIYSALPKRGLILPMSSMEDLCGKSMKVTLH